MDSVQESAHERVDRVWRRWISFYHDELGGIDPLLHETSPAEIDLIFRAFFAKYTRVEFDSKEVLLIPQDFKISPLPNEVESFVIQAMQIAESS